MNYTFQSLTSGRNKLRPYYDLIATSRPRVGHIEIVSYTINLLLTGSTKRGTNPSHAAEGQRGHAQHYHFIAKRPIRSAGGSMGNPWTGANVLSSGNLKLE